MTHRPERHLDAAELRAALDCANLPALVMTLFQMTGDERWLADPFRPTRGRGLDDHARGGFDDATANAIRGAAFDAIVQWWQDDEPAVDKPDLALFGRMLECYLGESVPAEYWAMFAVQHGIMPDNADVGHLDVPVGFSVAIIGAGVSGMLAAVRLGRAGVSFRIFERASDFGGVWLQNRYPGAGVDTPSNLYSYSDFRGDWSVSFARRDEMLAYLQGYADEHQLAEHVSFETTVETCRWDDERALWELTLLDPEIGPHSVTANVIISAVGLFSEPSCPVLDDIDVFGGDVFHSSHWPDGYDVAGKRVAVAGSGASAMQVVPALADQAGRVVVLQRTPQWIAPVRNYFDPIPKSVHWLWRNVPFYFDWTRTRSAWNFNDKNYPALVVDPAWEQQDRSISAVNEFHRTYFTAYIESKLSERPDLVAKSVPDYPPYGKRILLDNGWYDALLKPNVQLEDDALRGFTEHGIVTASGATFDVDAVVLCTGFQTSRYLKSVQVVGRDGTTLSEQWHDDNASAYLGTTTPGFPNLFFMYGPATNAGGGSFVSIAESQIGHIMMLLAELIRRGCRSLEPAASVTADYNSRLDEANSQMVWSHPGMSTYVRNSTGRVTVNMPWRVVDYWKMMSAPVFDDYVIDGAERQ